ncbi:MAG: sce7726 family protein [Thalassolituus sp.]|uniref:sce7726 family protein n=1 Tax=Thalassolituus sp. TaxID=2030822 RepID=UPI003981E63F
MKLNDKKIRDALIFKLITASKTPYTIIEEHGVERGKALADVVAVYKHTHCFEIKSDLDSLSRLKRQIVFYDRSFQKISIVVTAKYLSVVGEYIPEHWGVMEAYTNKGSVCIRYVRGAKCNKNISVDAVLKGMWKSELENIYECLSLNPMSKSASKDKLILGLENISREKILTVCTQLLRTRNERKFSMMNSK